MATTTPTASPNNPSVSAPTPPPAPEEAAPPDAFPVSLISANGSGCKTETVRALLAADNSSINLHYADFIAEAGPGTKPSDFRKNCSLALEVQIPAGYSVAIARAEYRGYAAISSEATGQVRAAYFWQGGGPVHHSWVPLKGPYEGDYKFTDKTDAANAVWSQCGERKLLNINQELRVLKGKSSGYSMITTDTTDQTLVNSLRFQWKRCK